MSPELQQRVWQTWAAHFGLERFDQPGTTLVPRDYLTPKSWLSLWPVGARTVIEVAPDLLPDVQRIVDAHPASHRLTVADFERAWGSLETSGMGLFALDATTFRPLDPAPPFTARQLVPADAAAFDAFYATGSDHDRAQADMAIDNDVVFGVLDGERVVAAASTYEWAGFVDIGVMTDPAYRRRGLAAAVVAALCAHHLASGDPRVMIYRHDVVNEASKRVAERLGLALYAVIPDFRRA